MKRARRVVPAVAAVCGALAGLVAFGLGQMSITVLIANVIRFHSARRSPDVGIQMDQEATVPAQTVRARPPASVPAGVQPVLPSPD